MMLKNIISAGGGNAANKAQVIIIAGQSNALGFSTGAPTEPHLNAKIDGCKIWTGSIWETLEFGVNNEGFTNTDHGPELNIGYLLSLVHGDVRIIKSAEGSTSLENDWASGGDNYTEMLTKVNAAIANLTTNSISFNLNSFVWNQGERDAGVVGWANNYATNLDSLVDRVRSDINAGLSFVTVRLHTDGDSTFLTTVRAAQAAIAKSRSAFINVDTEALQVDDIHMTSDGQNQSAQRYYDKIITL